MATNHIKVNLKANTTWSVSWTPAGIFSMYGPTEHRHSHGQKYHSPVGNGCALGRWLANGIVAWELMRDDHIGSIWDDKMVKVGHWECCCPMGVK